MLGGKKIDEADVAELKPAVRSRQPSAVFIHVFVLCLSVCLSIDVFVLYLCMYLLYIYIFI